MTFKSEELPALNPEASLNTAPDTADSIIYEVVSPVKVPICAWAIVTVSAEEVTLAKLSVTTTLKLFVLPTKSSAAFIKTEEESAF